MKKLAGTRDHLLPLALNIFFVLLLKQNYYIFSGKALCRILLCISDYNRTASADTPLESVVPNNNSAAKGEGDSSESLREDISRFNLLWIQKCSLNR